MSHPHVINLKRNHVCERERERGSENEGEKERWREGEIGSLRSGVGIQVFKIYLLLS